MMKNIKLYITAVFIGCVLHVNAQEDLKISSYSMQHVVYSPALAIAFDNMTITANARKQWNFSGAPINGSLSINSKIKQSKSFITGHVNYERLSIYDKLNSSIGFVQAININDNNIIGLGISMGINSVAVDLNRASYESGDYVINNNLISENYLLAGTGVSYYGKSNKVVGSVYFNDLLVNRNFNTYLSKRIETRMLEYDISTLFKYSLNTMRYDLDLTALAMYKNMIGIGLSYRVNKQIVPMARININNKFTFGYAYDIHLGELSGLNGHEITLRGVFGSKSINKKIGFSNPRI